MSNPYHAMRLRLWNWGRYCRIDPCRPDSSCANPLYDFMVGRAEGYGDEEDAAKTVRVARAGEELDPMEVIDAAALDDVIQKIDREHRILLVRKYVLRSLRPAPAAVDAAIRAIWEIEDGRFSETAA